MATTTRKVAVEGLKELDEALGELPKATGVNVLKQALLAGGEPIRRTAQRLAPVAKRPRRRKNRVTLPGRLRGSIIVGTTLSRRQKIIHRQWAASLSNAGIPRGWFGQPSKTVWVFVGPHPFRETTPQEFGTAHNRAHPYMRPAWDAEQDKALETIKYMLSVYVWKAIERMEAKAARLAAKIKAGK